MTQYAVVKGEPRDAETMIERLRVTHEKLRSTYDEFNKVMDLAEQLWPKQDAQLGIALHCKHCDVGYAEKRDKHSPEHGFCSVKCFEAEVVR